jgi:hypothetical protein
MAQKSQHEDDVAEEVGTAARPSEAGRAGREQSVERKTRPTGGRLQGSFVFLFVLLLLPCLVLLLLDL